MTAVAVVGGALLIPTSGSAGSAREGGLRGSFEVAKGQAGLPHTDPNWMPAHSHNDPATKNSVTRAAATSTDSTDPTTAAERTAATAYVAAGRRSKDPQLKHVAAYPKRTSHPRTKYALANGCYTLVPGGAPLFFKPTDLGDYLLYDADRQFVTAGDTRAAAPSDATVWTASMKGASISFTNADAPLEVAGRTSFVPTVTKGCTAYPESQVDVRGGPTAGVSPIQEVRGYVDAHTHGMAFEFLGGDAHCGKPWDRFGVEYALVDCPDHTYTGGYGGVLEDVLSGEVGHDPVGWPTFKDWPAPNSLTHEGTYYRWMERAWRGGLRVFTNLLVENNQLCMIYPIKHNSCDDMDAVRLQAQDMYDFQDYVDAQFGGPGKGFYRIVKNPFEARRVINAGKLAVVMGIETSVPFGCSYKRLPTGDLAQCDADSIDDQIDEVHDLGVRQMELVNKFDNALSGVTGDQGELGVVINGANFLETGSFWDMQHCDPADGESHDQNQVAFPDVSAGQQDALFGAIAGLFGTLNLTNGPLYPTPDHCNARGLTTLGAHTIDRLVQKKIIFDPDHMSVEARNQSLDQIEALGYHGVVSSHSWSTPDAYPRVYELGGFITPYAGDSTGFVDKWRTHVGWADQRYYYGIGYGADINGLGAQGNPRGADVPNPVTYPFKGLGGVTIEQQRAGERVYDINVDGVAQYGLYPDWIQDLKLVAGKDGAAITEDMTRGAEAYLQMWERAYGVAPDSCRNPENRLPVATVTRVVRRGMTTTEVMKAVGQPYVRLGRQYGFCASAPGQPTVRMTATFDRAGRVTGLRRS
ncbi:MAG: peptidase [Actinobacteria bacterium]|nr:peptidase [Actinomycetota bacterium]